MKIVKLRSCFSINFNSQIVEGSTYLWHHSLIDDHKLNVEGNLVLVAWSGTNKGIYGSCGVSKNTNAELQAIIYHGISVAWLQSQTPPRRRFLLPTLIILLSTRFGVTYSSIGTFVFNILSEMLIGQQKKELQKTIIFVSLINVRQISIHGFLLMPQEPSSPKLVSSFFFHNI